MGRTGPRMDSCTALPTMPTTALGVNVNSPSGNVNVIVTVRSSRS